MFEQTQPARLPQRIENLTDRDPDRDLTEAAQASATLFGEYRSSANTENVELANKADFGANTRFWLTNRLMPEEELVSHAKSVANKLDNGKKFEAAKEYDQFQQKLDHRNYITFNELVDKFDKKRVGYDFSISKFSKAYLLKQPTR